MFHILKTVVFYVLHLLPTTAHSFLFLRSYTFRPLVYEKEFDILVEYELNEIDVNRK
jgi:hypothetical protein